MDDDEPSTGTQIVVTACILAMLLIAIGITVMIHA